LNVEMPVLNGFDAAREIKAKLPESAIVILSLNGDRHLVEEAKKIGARAYVAKTRAGVALVEAIEEAMIGGDFVLVDKRIQRNYAIAEFPRCPRSAGLR
jgi:two-component system, NarL family, response regulator DegU